MNSMAPVGWTFMSTNSNPATNNHNRRVCASGYVGGIGYSDAVDINVHPTAD